MTRFLPLATALLSLTAVAVAQERQSVIPPIQFDAQRGELTIAAKGRLLSDVLRELKSEHGVAVTVAGLVDRVIDRDLGRQSLPAALRELLGPDARYRIDTGTRDIAFPAPASSQPDQAAPRSDRPRMDAGPITPRAGATTMDAAPKRTGDVEMTPAGRIFANLADLETVRQVLDQHVPAETGSHAAMILRLAPDGSARVHGIYEVPGRMVPSTYLHGPFLWSIESGSKIVAVGAMGDPLQAVPISEGRPVGATNGGATPPAAEAVITLTLDAGMLDRDTLARTRIRFHRLRDGAGLPEQLTPDTFPVFLAKSDPVSTLEAKTLAGATIVRRN